MNWNYTVLSLSSYVHLLSNVMVALFVGIPLEMVHRWWRLLILYLAGVIAGSLAASMFDPHVSLLYWSWLHRHHIISLIIKKERQTSPLTFDKVC